MLRIMEVEGEQLSLPPAYGTPTTTLAWSEVESRLVSSAAYWLVTTRPDGRPHAVPVDGIWWGDSAVFGGSPETVHIRNLRADPRAVLHTESASSPVIVEGTADWWVPQPEETVELGKASQRKYGYVASPHAYRSGTWRLRPRRVLAWTVLYEDATRFVFPVDPG
jgi:hypothetical protein